LSVSMPMLIMGQLLQGFGLGTVPLAVGIMRDTQSEARMKFGNGIMVGTIFAFTALAMLVAGPIADHLDYHWLFWMPFVVLAAIIPAVWLLVPPCPAAHQGRSLDLVGAALFGGSLATLLVAFTYAPDWGWISARFLVLVGVAVTLFVVFIAAELRRDDPLVDVRILGGHEVLIASALMITAGFTVNLFFVMLPMQIQQPRETGYGLSASGTLTSYLLVPGVLIGTTAPLASWIESRLGRRLASALPPMIAVMSFLLMSVSAGQVVIVGAAMLLCGFSSGIGITQALNIVATVVPEDRVSAFSGINFVIKAIGSTSGVQIAASILSTDAASASESPAWSAFLTVFALGGVVSLLTALFALSMPRRTEVRGSVRPREAPVRETAS